MTLATPRQIAFLRKLLDERQLDRSPIGHADLERLDSKYASTCIDTLLRLPYKQAAQPVRPQQDPHLKGDLWPTVREGRYAVIDPADGVLKFFRVDKPVEGRWAGFTFLNVFASDETYPIKNMEHKKAVMDAIAVNPREAMAAYGQHIGKCGHCGRTLTDAESRRIGIGPVCRGEVGY